MQFCYLIFRNLLIENFFNSENINVSFNKQKLSLGKLTKKNLSLQKYPIVILRYFILNKKTYKKIIYTRFINFLYIFKLSYV